MNAHALPLYKTRCAPTKARRLRLRRRRTLEIHEERRPAPDMTWAISRLAPRV
jgi:hypothetical protein